MPLQVVFAFLESLRPSNASGVLEKPAMMRCRAVTWDAGREESMRIDT